MRYKHKYIKGLSIELIGPTKKGYKVLQTELYNISGTKKLRKPKVITTYIYEVDLLDFNKIDHNFLFNEFK
tara:strand:+ start:39 stop:251 length:213 start_codon:yes stop_codon:yes gene_type:complete